MKNHKGFRRFICVTVLCALLMVSMGRATRVSAVGTTATIAATAFILTGAVYLSYLGLTQASVAIPAAEQLHDWLGDIGRKVSQYPSGSEAYQDIYQGLLRDPTANVIDGVWTWTQDRLRSFANDFVDTRLIQDLVSYQQSVDVSQTPTNTFAYPITPAAIPNVYVTRDDASLTGSPFPASWVVSSYSGVNIYYTSNGYASILSTNLSGEFRNYFDGTYYRPQQYLNGVWTNININTLFGLYAHNMGSSYVFRLSPTANLQTWYTNDYGGIVISNPVLTYPLFPNEVIYDSTTDETIPLVVPSEYEVVQTPQWLDPDNENRPIIPWVPIPDIPTGVPTPSGYTGPPQWGFPLQDLLDMLEELATALMSIDAIARLINEFAGQHGDNYYLEYNDGDTNYYTYYQPTIFDNDTEYVTYNIDISEQQDIVPVDLNTISLYTKNEYLDAVKQSARKFGDAIGEYVAFWHNSDYTLTYTILGGFVLILIGAFIGKWGHS